MIAKQDHQFEQTVTAKLDRLCARDLIPKLHVGGSVRFRLSDVIGIVQNGV